jgi:hypothetical protein
MKEIVLRFVYEAIDDINLLFEEDQKIDKKLETKLCGVGVHLDSLVFVSLIESVEQKLEEFYQQKILLTDDLIMQMIHRPNSTIATFVENIETIIAERVKRKKY